MRIQSIVVLCLSLGLAVGAAAQEVHPYTFRMVMDGDTVASDVVRRTPTGVEIDLIYTIAGVRSDLTQTVAPDERVTGVTQRTFGLEAPDTVPVHTLVVEFVGDSVRGELTRPGRGTQRSVFPTTAGAVVYLEASSAMVEQVLRRARAMGGETATVPVFDLLTARTAPAVVRWVGADSAVVSYGELEVHASVDDGSLLGYTVPALGAHVIRLEGAHPLVPHESAH